MADGKTIRETSEVFCQPLFLLVCQPGACDDCPANHQLDRAELRGLHLVHRDLEFDDLVRTLFGLFRMLLHDIHKRVAPDLIH